MDSQIRIPQSTFFDEHTQLKASSPLGGGRLACASASALGCNTPHTHRRGALKFAEFHTDQVLHAGPYAVRETEVLDFAKQWDPQWFHTDPEAAACGPFDGLIASG